MPGPVHPLDRPVWGALTSRQRGFAVGDRLALRFPAEVAPFAATLDSSPASFSALERLLSPEDTIAMVLADDQAPPPTFEQVRARPLEQMLGTALAGQPLRADVLPLGVDDVPEMLALVELAKPGPFAVRTLEMGTYLGVRSGQRLVAMAGERMGLDGFTEISAVCTHPDHRGHGHARALITALVQALSARGELPFLHVIGENQAAIGLYQQLGFRFRRRMHLNILRLAR